MTLKARKQEHTIWNGSMEVIIRNTGHHYLHSSRKHKLGQMLHSLVYKKLVMVAVWSSEVIIDLSWVTSREWWYVKLAKLMNWVRLGPGQASILSWLLGLQAKLYVCIDWSYDSYFFKFISHIPAFQLQSPPKVRLLLEVDGCNWNTWPVVCMINTEHKLILATWQTNSQVKPTGKT